MRALSDNYTPTAVITPEQMRETVAHHWRASSFLLQICNISTAHGWRKSKNLASHGSLLQRLKYLVPATIELNPPPTHNCNRSSILSSISRSKPACSHSRTVLKHASASTDGPTPIILASEALFAEGLGVCIDLGMWCEPYKVPLWSP